MKKTRQKQRTSPMVTPAPATAPFTTAALVPGSPADKRGVAELQPEEQAPVPTSPAGREGVPLPPIQGSAPGCPHTSQHLGLFQENAVYATPRLQPHPPAQETPDLPGASFLPTLSPSASDPRCGHSWTPRLWLLWAFQGDRQTDRAGCGMLVFPSFLPSFRGGGGALNLLWSLRVPGGYWCLQRRWEPEPSQTLRSDPGSSPGSAGPPLLSPQPSWGGMFVWGPPVDSAADTARQSSGSSLSTWGTDVMTSENKAARAALGSREG